MNDAAVNGAAITAGRYGNARSYDAIDDYIEVPHSSTLNFSTNITVEAWVRHVSGSGLNPRILSKGQITGYELFLNGTGAATEKKLAFAARNSGGDLGLDLISRSNLLENRWYHVAYTYNGNSKKWYINGVLDTSSSVSASLVSSPSPLTIGTITNNHNDGLYKGIIDEVRISSVARSASDFPLQLPPVLTAVTATGTTIDLNWSNGGGAAP